MARIVRMLLLAVLALAPAGFIRAQEVGPTEIVSFHGLTFPAAIAGAERFSVRDYEKDNPGLGYSVGYRAPDVVSTVYIYDLKTSGIPEDPSAPSIKAQFAQAKGDMLRAVRQGTYAKIDLKDQFSIEDARKRPRLVCVAATLVPTGQPTELASYLCVGGWKDKFIKFRTTGEQLPESAFRRFVQAWVDLLWPS